MKISTNDDLREHGLDDIANLDIAFVLPRMMAGHTVLSVGQNRLASRASKEGRKLGVTLNRYFVVEANGKVWPVELGRLRQEGENGHSLPPLAGPRMPLESVSNLHGDLAMKLDVGERALLRLDALAAVQEVYPLLGWQATFERATIHYNPKTAALAALLLVRRTA